MSRITASDQAVIDAHGWTAWHATTGCAVCRVLVGPGDRRIPAGVDLYSGPDVDVRPACYAPSVRAAILSDSATDALRRSREAWREMAIEQRAEDRANVGRERDYYDD